MATGNGDSKNSIAFDQFRFEPATGYLTSPEGQIRLRPQACSLLALLATHPNEVISRQAIREHVWPERAVVEFDQAITTTIKELRKALGESARKQRLIVTVPAKGYRFTAPAAKHTRPVKSDASRAPKVIVAIVAVGLLLWALIHWLPSPSPSPSPSPAQLPRVAVLPFDDLRPSGELHPNLSAALQLSLIGHLGRVGSDTITTLGRRSILDALESDLSVTHELDVGLLIEGDLRIAQRPEREPLLIVTVSIIDTEDDGYLWGEVITHTYDDPLLIDRLSARVGEGLVAALGLGDVVIPELILDDTQ